MEAIENLGFYEKIATIISCTKIIKKGLHTYANDGIINANYNFKNNISPLTQHRIYFQNGKRGKKGEVNFLIRLSGRPLLSVFFYLRN